MLDRYLVSVRFRTSRFLFLLTAISCLTAIVTAYTTIPLEGAEASPREVAEAKAVREESFRETLDTYEPAQSDEEPVINLLKAYRDAYNTSDLSRMERLLASNFELRYRQQRSKKLYAIMVQSREKYLEKRSPWSPDQPRRDHMIVNVRDVLLHPDGKTAVVIAATTYKSKYFHPRYIETFGFKKTPDGWLLRRVLVVLARRKPEELDVQIILSRFPGGKSPIRDFNKIVKEEGPDAFVERYQQRSRGSIRNDELPHSVLFVFAEPPTEDTILVTQHQFRRPGMSGLRPYRFDRKVFYGVSPFYVIENVSQAGGRPAGSITYSIFVGDVLVADKRVSIWN